MRACVVIAILGLSAGCAWTPKPYATDPLIRTRTALPGDPLAPAAAPPRAVPEPPDPPDGELVASAGYVPQNVR
jgi:hypothetical protein